MTQTKSSRLLLAAFAALRGVAGCGGLPGDEEPARSTPAGDIVPTVAPLYIKDVANQVVRNVDPGFLQHLLGQLHDEGNADQAERLARTYDVGTGKLNSFLGDIRSSLT